MELRNHIVSIIAETLHVPAQEITDDRKLIDIAKDSIALFELLIRFEKALNRHVTYEDIAHVETVGDVIAFASSLPSDLLAPALQPHATRPTSSA